MQTWGQKHEGEHVVGDTHGPWVHLGQAVATCSASETPAFVQIAFQAAVPDSRKSFPEVDNEDDSLGTLVALRGGRRRVRHNMGLVHSGTRCQTRPGGSREPGASFCKAHAPLSTHKTGRCAGV